MKKKVGIVSVLLALTLAVNAVTPALSETIQNAFSQQPRAASVLNSLEEYASADEEAAASVPVQKEAAYDDGKILIYNYAQLSMIGSGESYEYDDGVTATYAPDAEYKIVRDIALPRHTLWQLPEGFTGTVTGEKQSNAPLYDGQKDAIYLYNPYQLAVMAMDDRGEQPVMSGDADASTFGSGKVVCTDEENKHILTYGDDRNYVISAQFCSEVAKKPISVRSDKSVESVGAKADTSVGAAAPYDGRDFAGQVLKEIDGETYILIGNAEQLRAIGTNKDVYSAIYQIHHVVGGDYSLDLDSNNNPIMLYGGDADLLQTQNGKKDYAFQNIDDKSLLTYKSYGSVDQSTGSVYLDATHTSDLKSSDQIKTGKKYTNDANYIIFRNIDLGGSSNPWTPLMFTGNMFGIKSTNNDKLWNGSTITDATAMIDRTTANRPVISNVYVNNSDPIDVDKFVGIGFFATVTNEINVADVGVSSGTVHVENLELSQVEVHNSATATKDTVSIVNTLTTGLGWLVGGLLDVTTTVLSIGSMNLSLRDTLSALLNARAQDATVFATGGFAGRVVGDVEITNCAVTGSVTVENAKDRTGGFIGYSEGATQYSGLSQALGMTTDALSSLLNAIPGLGLGDLISILLDNALPLRDLIPTGYIAPKIKSCEVNGLTGYLGTTTTNFAGGFIGQQIGTRIENGSVTPSVINGEASTFTVRADNYGGGFCGLARDAEIKGTLDGIGIDLSSLVQDIHPQSVIIDSNINNCSYTVSGGNFLGGFIGAMASSYAIDSNIECSQKPITVTGTGDYAGGFAGCATVGWQSSLGKDENNENSLLGTVRQLVTGLTSTNPSVGQKLLTLMGVSPSAILGCQVYSSELNVQAGGSFAGGLVGKGDGIYLGRSDQAAYTALAAWNSGTLKETPTDRPVILTGINSVTSGDDYAGGVAGYMGSAAFQGLLNDVVGLGDFIGFTASDITVTGVSGGYTVTAGQYNAGGGFGSTVGGTVTRVDLFELKRVQALNRAAGFVGVAGPGELAGTGGLTVNLLGLDRVLQAKNLLSVGEGVEVEITDCNVTGISSGFEAEATGTNPSGAQTVYEYTAAGFIADSNSTKIINSHTDKLKSVTAADANGFAGGFIGTSKTGGLAEVADTDNTGIGTSSGSTVEDGFYLIKPEWTISALAGKFSPNPNSEGEYMLRTTLAEGDKIKVVKVENGAITAWYPDGTGNEYTVDAAHANDVTIYFKESYQGAWVSFGGYFYVEANGNSLHGLDDFVNTNTKVLDVNGLVDAIGYLIPSYTNCTTTFVDGGWVNADIAGGFVADLESGTVNNSTIAAADDPQDPKWTKTMKEIYDPDAINPTDDPVKQFAVFNVDYVHGRTYGGGFGGKLRSGALADAGKGVSILGDLKVGGESLSISLSDLAKVMNAYVPFVYNAGVYSDNGFTVTANTIRSGDSLSGSAGGFAGYMSGAQVSNSDVYQLKNTAVNPPSDLEAVSASSYFNNSAYAVTGGHFAGGYVGFADIGDAASVGHGLGVLGSALNLGNVASALSVVVTTIEHSDVQGAAGGFSVIADGTDLTGKVGRSGGYAGEIAGAHIQNSHCKNFYYIIGQETAGGYVGDMKPGNVANLLDNASVISTLVSVDGSLLSLVEDFVPTIRNSTTSCVPCGGAVRADAASDGGHQRGCAGGYCGLNEGGHIWGLNTNTWQRQNDGVIGSRNFGHDTEGNYTGERHTATAWRIRSVYGAEYAGGFTGYMESADTAGASGVSLLGGLISANNILGALSAVYPTEEHTAVYGPLRNVDAATWNSWVTYVGKYGGYGAELAQTGTVSDQAELNGKLSKYIYGCNVVAGRSTHDNMLISDGGCAGGYVGYMVSGVITDGQSYDMKRIRAMRSAGGYAGKMQTGGAANFGSVSILGLNLNVGKLAKAVETFVPTVKSGTVRGWQSGMTVESFGVDHTHGCGFAGGYAGSAYGAQIWGDENAGSAAGTGCSVTNLRYVKGSDAVGGYVGTATAASVADVNTNSSNGLLQAVLNALISTPADLVNVMQATVTTIRQASVSPDNTSFGFTVGGSGNATPRVAGGFAGSLEAAVIGSRKGESDVTVNGLRSVDGLYYAGGFVGLADVGSIASVSNTGTDQTTLLGLINAGSVDLLDIFRTYIYYSDVNGVADGIVVRAYESAPEGFLSELRESGCAGGFGGGIMNGTVNHSDVTNLNTVYAPNYTGGFIGHMGKNGAVDVDKTRIPILAGLDAGAIDVFGTTINECSVAGISAGSVITATEGAEPISGGFAGYADDAQIKNSDVTNLKQVYSDQIAGGFIGKTNMSYLVSAEVDSEVVQLVLIIVNALVKALYVDDLESVDLINFDERLIGLKFLSDGDLLYVNLLGLRIGVSLVKSTDPNVTDTALITIGDSTVALPCNENGIDLTGQNAEAVVNLIKANRTRVDNCTVTGISGGYDVYGGGASNTEDGAHANGYAGGFVGYNNEGKFTSDTMIYCDVVRGTAQKVGPFSGGTKLESVYDFNTLESIEKVSGEENHYFVYRDTDSTYALTGSGNQQIGAQGVDDNGTDYKKFDVTHLASPITPGENEEYYKIYGKWNGAKLASDATGADATAIRVYVSNAKAVLMLDTPTYANDESLIPNPGESKDPCDETIDLTIQKIWNDQNNKGKSRPDSIKVRILQHWSTEDGSIVMDGSEEKTVVFNDSSVIADADANGWFTISRSEHGRAGSATWTRVVSGLPVYTIENETTYYFSYSVEEAPIVGYESLISYDETGSTATATITNTPKSLEIQFKYYDRYRDELTFAGIQDTETTYSMTVDGIPQDYIRSSGSGVSVDYSGLIGEKAVEFSENVLSVNNVMCDYDLWTKQEYAVQSLNTDDYFYFINGTHVPYGSSQIYHTDYLGKPQSSDETKWVSYYAGDYEVTEENAYGDRYADVTKIVVWCYNYPKLYDVDIYGANSYSDVKPKTVDGKTVYVADSVRSGSQMSGANCAKFYYNQRFGDATGDTNQNNMTGMDNAGFIANYGLPGYTGVKPSDYAVDSFENGGVTYNFAYWAYDQEGTQIASVELDFWYRVTTDTKLFAVYAEEGSAPGISISADTNDTYVDSSGVSRTRLNILASVYGAPNYDTNVQKLAFTYIALSTQIRDNPAVYTPEKINALFEQYKGQLKQIIEKYDEDYGSRSFSSAVTYDGAIDTETEQLDTNLQLTLTTKGFIYTVTSNGNSAETGDSTILLTNKNRAHFTTNFKTSALNINNTGSSGNTCMLYCGALKYSDEWKVSTNCLIYFNGKAVSNIANNWY